MCLQVEFFEPFWDSGEARVGELGARGWRAWMVQQERGGWIQPTEGKVKVYFIGNDTKCTVHTEE